MGVESLGFTHTGTGGRVLEKVKKQNYAFCLPESRQQEHQMNEVLREGHMVIEQTSHRHRMVVGKKCQGRQGVLMFFSQNDMWLSSCHCPLSVPARHAQVVTALLFTPACVPSSAAFLPQARVAGDTC